MFNLTGEKRFVINYLRKCIHIYVLTTEKSDTQGVRYFTCIADIRPGNKLSRAATKYILKLTGQISIVCNQFQNGKNFFLEDFVKRILDYLEPPSMAPFSEPIVEHATKKGTTAENLPIVFSANV